MDWGRPYNLRMRRKQSESLSSPPSSPEHSPPPPPSGRPRYRRQRSKRPRVCSPRSQLHNAVPSPTTHEASALFPVAEVSQLLPPPPPSPAAGYSEEVPVDISSEEEDHKPKIDDPLLRLKSPPVPIVRQHGSMMFVEKSLGITERVKSLLVSELLALPNTEIITMISKANRAFSALDCYGDDYISFYWTVRRFIHFNQELLVAETLRSGHCAVLEEVTRRYEEVVIEADDAEEALHSAGMNLAKSKDKVTCLTQRLEEAKSLVVRLEMELDVEVSEAVAWECEVGKRLVCHSSMEAKVLKVYLEEEEAKNLVYEVKKRCEEASSGIELMKNSFHSLGIS